MQYSNQDIPNLLKGRKNLIGLEIGVERGYSAYHVLKNCNFTKLYLIDPYLPYADSDSSHYCDRICQINNKNHCLNLLKEFKNFELIEENSDNAFNLILDESLDYIFIDGLHTYEQCSKDIKNYYPKLKKGGLFSGHDFNYCEGVNKSVNEFAKLIEKNILLCNNDVWYWEK